LQPSTHTGKLESTRELPTVARLRRLVVLGLASLIHGPGVADAHLPAQDPSCVGAACLTAELAELPPACREVLRLRNFEGLSFDRVARRMGLSPRVVRQLWLQGLAELHPRHSEEEKA
jgi:DNA-directed RNA polymerase specialized sigma24 family protein